MRPHCLLTVSWSDFHGATSCSSIIVLTMWPNSTFRSHCQNMCLERLAIAWYLWVGDRLHALRQTHTTEGCTAPCNYSPCLRGSLALLQNGYLQNSVYYYLGDKEKQPIITCTYMCIQFFLKDPPKLVSLLASGAAGCWDRDKKILTLFHAR